jgi:hypothetical protein
VKVLWGKDSLFVALNLKPIIYICVMKTKGAVVIVVFSILVIVLMGLVSLLPNTVELEAKYEYSNSKKEVLDFLSTTEHWKDWLFYVPKGELKYLQNGPKEGVGSSFKWFHDKEGDGVIEIKGMSSNGLTYELITDNGLFRERGSFVLSKKAGKTQVVWQDTLDVSTSLFGRWAAKEEGFAQRLNKKNRSVLVKIDSLMNAKR